jgi:DtxR family Mn-dependent transcriptional regulator
LPSLTIENYVKTIYMICARQENQPAATGQVAAELRVLPGTVTSMLKTLSESGLATYTPYEGVRLTDAGRHLALRVLRRHRLIELFLAETLGLSWDEVHDEAENMEHAVSDHLVDRIDAYLDYPEFDPHGDPIPKADGTIADFNSRTLADCPLGSAFRLVRVMDQSTEFLRYLSEAGLPLGAEGQIVANRPEVGIVTVRLADRETTLGRDAAEKLLVASPRARRAAT